MLPVRAAPMRPPSPPQTRASAAADYTCSDRVAGLRLQLLQFERGFEAQFNGRKPGKNGNWYGVPECVRALYIEYTRLRRAAREDEY